MSDLPAGTVTLLFSDIEGSTRLLQRTGDAYPELLENQRHLLRASFEQCGGAEVDTHGDSFFFAFASANDAAAAAAEAQRALAQHDWPDDNEIRVRIGIHTGEPTRVDGRYVGLDVHQAARVMAAGHGGQVLVSESTRALLDDRFQLRDLGEHRLKDLSGPQRLFQLQLEGLRSEFPPLKTLDNRPTNLPVQPHPLIGRVRELDEAEAILTRPDVRLLTLTGTGGAGKTRLALQLAANVIDEFADGVFFVSLAPIRDWELVIPTVAHTLGLREQPGQTIDETLSAYLHDKRLLLLLDNFEHVVVAARAVATLLASAPNLRVLTTSRTPLRLSSERTYVVPPLQLPDPQRLPEPTDLTQNAAVRLFADRAQAAVAEFAVTAANAQAVAEICVRLDGLPLAIELAAPRIRVLPPRALLARLDQRLMLLTGGAQDLDERHRTLRATIEWSHELLLAEERALFSRFGTFIGGCRFEAAEALCDPDGKLGLDLLSGLESLVEKSLLRQRADPDGEPRFWMLETIREFAVERLEATGAAAEARRRHADYFLELAERVDAESRTSDQAALFARLDSDNANLRAAAECARETDNGELLLRLATALWGFWAARGYVAEGRATLEHALALTGERPARALIGLCTLRLSSGAAVESVRADAQEALRAAEDLGDDFTLAQAWNLVGQLDIIGRMGSAERAWQRALSYAEHGGYTAEKAESVAWLLICALFGPTSAEDGIALCKEFHDADDHPTIRAWCCVERSVLEAMQGRFEVARELLAEGVRALEELGLKVYAANTAQEAFFVEMLAGDPAAAACALRASYEALERMGERRFLSTIAGLLAHALCAQGEHSEAESFSRASENLAAADDMYSQLLWRSARAKVRAGIGDLEVAERLAREAVAIAERTDALNPHADALLDLAEVLSQAGKHDEALAAAEEAVRRYEQKRNLPSLERAREMAKALASTSAA
jgi:predicted ATPase/class 3 adenylate cyclase